MLAAARGAAAGADGDPRRRVILQTDRRPRRCGASNSQPPVIVGHRHAVVVVSALGHRALSRAINWASEYLHGHCWHELAVELTEQEAAKLVKGRCLGRTPAIGFHTVGDTILVHVEELVEILADAAGDWTTVGCFLEELGPRCRRPARASAPVPVQPAPGRCRRGWLASVRVAEWVGGDAPMARDETPCVRRHRRCLM